MTIEFLDRSLAQTQQERFLLEQEQEGRRLEELNATQG
eukprot:CAMPEP_0173255672 /NCGR_PEP_ID=MMETSP1142-20121109/22675_1 /TAXON_ID=483371 /ORGANISM="non described non described, Strain CCMP2298" /LENGTH=37 /DNA_ID= /DNA_START= /DNA_END= /DNA_ORIENTATION=